MPTCWRCQIGHDLAVVPSACVLNQQGQQSFLDALAQSVVAFSIPPSLGRSTPVRALPAPVLQQEAARLKLVPAAARRVMVQGPGPSARYAHTLALVANRFLVAMGGNDGKQTLGDAWALDTSDKPYQWRKITDAGEPPVARCARVGMTQATR